MPETENTNGPKPGNETSSYKLVLLTLLFSILAPLPPLVAAIIVQKGWLPGALAPAIEQTITQMLVAASAALGAGGAYATGRALPAYIQQRGEVAKIKALAATGLTASTEAPSNAKKPATGL